MQLPEGTHHFKDEFLFYRFIDTDHGAVAVRDNRTLSWATFLAPTSPSASIPSIDLLRLPDTVTHVARAYWPMDTYNIRLLDNVHPPEWIDPHYSGIYQLAVIGAGVAGIEAASSATRLGAKVALIEANVLGGTSLSTGCVPSKALLNAANLVHKLRGDPQNLAWCGINLNGQVNVDFETIMKNVREKRAILSVKQCVTRITKKQGIDVFYGHAKFLTDHSLIVSGKTLEFKRVIIATGAYSSIPPIPGLRELYGAQDADESSRPRVVMTNDNLFNITSLPERLCVLGTGVIAMELAQAMQRLGSSVTMFGRADSVLPNEERDLVADIVRQMESDGVNFRLHVRNYDGVKLSGRVARDGRREVILQTQERGGQKQTYRFDGILVASGRKPNVTGLNLEAASVDYDSRRGIKVNDIMQTTNPKIFAIGDCCSSYKMAHAALATAKAAVRNALLMRRDKDLLVPFVAHTEPNFARVGPTSLQMDEEGRLFDVVEFPFEQIDRAWCDGDTTGMLRLFMEPTSLAIIGGAALGNGAVDMISELMIAMASETKLDGLSRIMHPFPTMPEAIRQAALQVVEAREKALIPKNKFRSSRRQSVNKSRSVFSASQSTSFGIGLK